MKKIKTLIAAAVLGLGVTVSSISPAAVSMQTAEAATVKQGLVKVKNKMRQVILGHLSKENNDPSVAMLAVRNTLIEQNIIPGKGITLDVAMRDCCSRIYQV